MAKILQLREYLTFDDVLIRPRQSDIKTREQISTAPDFLHLSMNLPIISANMDYVTGPDMAIAMWNAGGLGILHRFTSKPQALLNASLVYQAKVPVIVSIGVRSDDDRASIDNYMNVLENRVHAVCIDVAHGDHEQVIDLIKKTKDKYPDLKVIAGNIATAEGFWRLAKAGADAIKVGIGPGSVCTTRTVTGIGVPQLSAIMEVAEARKTFPVAWIIADGGIKTSGDITKAIAAGADVVMLGHLLAGASECPGPVIDVGDGRKYRQYRGQSIFGTNGIRESPEGISGYVEDKGPVEGILRRLGGGLRSGMSYVGASTIRELQDKAEFIKVSPMSHIENGTRVQVKI